MGARHCAPPIPGHSVCCWKSYNLFFSASPPPGNQDTESTELTLGQICAVPASIHPFIWGQMPRAFRTGGVGVVGGARNEGPPAQPGLGRRPPAPSALCAFGPAAQCCVPGPPGDSVKIYVLGSWAGNSGFDAGIHIANSLRGAGAAGPEPAPGPALGARGPPSSRPFLLLCPARCVVSHG